MERTASIVTGCIPRTKSCMPTGARRVGAFSGIWDVKDGKLVASGEVYRSDSGSVQTYQVEERIESLTEDELVLVNDKGNRLVRHRKRF
jgi:hypothetical protein